MKYLLLICLFLAGCVQSSQDNIPDIKVSSIKIDSNNTLVVHYEGKVKVYTYEGCEYIICGGYNWAVMSHKGNCKNPIHHYQSSEEATRILNRAP